MNIRLIRYANEGFFNYEQSHIKGVNGIIQGCHAFIEVEQEELLLYREEIARKNPSLHNRLGQTRHIITMPEESAVYVKNVEIDTRREHLFINSDRNFIVIPQKPIIESKLVMDTPFPLSMDMYVEVPIGFAWKQYKELLGLYKWIREEFENPEEITINTKIIDFCQCIVTI
ncbi:hypothetical protein ACFVS2_20305 [Brevibacillus sp. NPDC058079]|uniref:hypothetical protein n=1 Tax=Brevibacillus sp. NPDC058079 TaxID=3346330 RepID=UPI0036E595C7